MSVTMVVNAKKYDWSTWLMGIMRSFLSGAAIALTTGTGGALLSIPSTMLWKLMGINFLVMGLYRMGEFLQLHGAPDQVQASLKAAAEATQAVAAQADAAAEAVKVAQNVAPNK
jgi:hypothetical protein